MLLHVCIADKTGEIFMRNKGAARDATNRPFLLTITSTALNVLLWSCLLILSTGVIWTTGHFGTWSGCSWLLGGGTLLFLVAIVRRQKRRNLMIKRGQTKTLEQQDTEDATARHSWLAFAVSSLETIIWVCLFIISSVVYWTNHTYQRVTIPGMIYIGIIIFTVIVVGRLGWMWAGRGTREK